MRCPAPAGTLPGLARPCRCDYTGRLGWEERDYTPPVLLLAALAAVNRVNAGKIAAESVDRGNIPERIRRARIQAVRQLLNEPADQPEQG